MITVAPNGYINATHITDKQMYSSNGTHPHEVFAICLNPNPNPQSQVNICLTSKLGDSAVIMMLEFSLDVCSIYYILILTIITCSMMMIIRNVEQGGRVDGG